MQKYKEINGNDYVKDSRTTINETMRSIQSMNSGTVFPTTNLFEGMKCYRTDLKKTYTLTDVENNTWVEDAHAALADEATHAASTTKLQTPRALNLSGAVTADAASFDGTANATINVKTLDATKLKGTAPVSTTGNAATATKLATARTIALGGNASGSTTFDGSGNVTINATVNESAHAATATKVVTTAAAGASANIAEATMAGSDYARIRVSGNSDAGELALETADNGNEAIVARQYTGDFKDVARTASILDANGNTSFPGTVVAPKFTGTLNGNAATASKLITPRTLSLTGKAAGSTSFDGSGNASINVTNVNADTASKLSTARKINITGNATGSGTFDGSADANISVTVNESKHAAAADTLKSSPATETSTVARPVWLSWEGDNTKQTVSPNLTYTCSTKTLAAANFKGHLAGNADTATKATSDANGNELANAQRYMHVYDLPDKTNFDNVKTTGIYTCTQDNYTNKPVVSWGVLRVYWFNNNVKQEYVPDNRNEVWERYFTGGEWNAWSKVNAANADTAAACSGNSATATKLATARTIRLTGNASGSANFDGSGNVSINTTVSQAANADKIDGYHENSFLRYRGTAAATGEDTLWSQIGIKEYDAKLPKGISGTYNYGSVISLPGVDTRLDIWYNHQCSQNKDGLWYRSGWGGHPCAWARLLDSNNYTNWVPTKTGSGASGTWGINISGTATNADKLDGYHASDIIGKITAANTGGIVAASLTANGYVKFANGLILQWGTTKYGGKGHEQHNYPIAFPNAVFSITGALSDGGSGGANWSVGLVNNTTYYIFTDESSLLSWMAVGY